VRLRINSIENLTRWSSTFLMLESIKHAYDRDAFNENFPCDINLDLKTNEINLQILKPAYELSIKFQKNSGNISDTIPYLLNLKEFCINLYSNSFPPSAGRFCRLLVKCVDQKFEYEYNSNIHRVFNNFKHKFFILLKFLGFHYS
jgi:hypothetical protein